MSVDVADWLRGLGLEQYAVAFRDNDIGGELLAELTAEDLIGLGITSIGHRRRMLAAIAALCTKESVASIASEASPDRAERRQLTVMFCDLVGSTELAARLDPEDLRTVIGQYHRALAKTVAPFDAFIAKYMGDGAIVYFGYPTAHEDDAERAVRAALALINEEIIDAAGSKLRFRVGIATGLAVVGDMIGIGVAQEENVIGETPNLAARLQALAEPGTILIDYDTRRLIGGLFELIDLGPQEMRGFGDRKRVWQIVEEGQITDRFEALRSGETPLVGRNEELDLLLRRWSRAKAGQGRVVLLGGEPGIGKSRLTAALRQRVECEPHTRLRYFCLPHHQDSALHPFIAHLERASGFDRGDTAEAKVDKLLTLIGQTAKPDDISLIAEMMSLPGGGRYRPLDLSPQRRKERTLAALLRQLEGLAARQPVLMIIEDLHWIDPTSRDLLDLTIERIKLLPVLLIGTYRPEFLPPWAGQPQVTVITLNRLNREEGAALVQQLAGNFGSLPGNIVDEILERTDGVPLFVEELTKAVVEAGTDRGEAAVSGVPPYSFAVPATLHASLLGRLDRLGAAAKQVAQVGAAIGRDFSYELLSAACHLSEPALQNALRRLADSGLVFERGAPPTAEYLFKHALVQDIAYSTLLRGPRQALHRRIAEALEERLPALIKMRPQIAAHHFSEAGVADKAVAYWHLAGKLSVTKSAVQEATTQLRRGLRLLDGLAEGGGRKQLELDIHVTLTAALIGAKGYTDPELVTVLERAQQLVADIESVGSPQHFSVLYGLWAAYYVAGKPEPARVQALDFLSLAEAGSDSRPLLIGHRLLATAMMMSGNYQCALPHIEMAVSLYRPEEHREFTFPYGQDIGVSAFVYLSWALWHHGYPDQSARATERALEYCRQLGHAYTHSYALWHIGMAAIFARRVADAGTYANDCIGLASEHGFPIWAAYGRIFQGWVAAQKGDPLIGIARIREGLSAAEATGSRAFEPCVLGLLAEALAVAGEVEEGIAVVNDALSRSAASGQRGADAELHRLRGELARRMSRSDPTKAECSFRAALAIAQQQGTRGYELRAANSLARLLADTGRRAEARKLLAPIYDRFTEGFDTPDLIEAKAQLHRLA